MEGIATGLAVDAGKAMVGGALKAIRDVRGFKYQLGRLKKELSKTQAFLTDLGNGKHAKIESSLVNNWLKEVKKVTCSAENLMDDYQYEMLRRKLEFKIFKTSSSRSSSNNQSPRSSISFKKKWSSYMKRPATNPLVFQIRMTYRVTQILSEFNELYKEAGEIGLKPVNLATKSASTSKIEDFDLNQIREYAPTQTFIGREKDQNTLLKMLRNPTFGPNEAHDLPIIAIVGHGGLGKTSLARHLFEHKTNEGPFDGEKVWICVSENFHVKTILKEMVEPVTGTKCIVENMESIIKELQNKLKGKKLFLVLDDLWEEKKELWDLLKSLLQRIGVLVGSAILITTRINGVAEAACSSDVHRLERLSKEEEWKLLTSQFSFDPSLYDVARSILNKCDGVPLAILAIKRVLRSLKNQSDWKQIEQSNVWDIKQNPTDKNYVMPSLLLSYNHFNHVSLKRCFACCAIFPKDRVISKGELIALWLAQDLLYDEHESSSNNSCTKIAETIGEKYIDILVNNSFLSKEQEEKIEVDLGWYETYKMHDLVHDLASYVSKEDLLVCKVGDEVKDACSHLKDKVEDTNSHLRHLAFDLSENKTAPPETVTKKKLSKLRTISFWNGVPKWNTLICAKYMRTLIMDGIGLGEVPTIIGQLVHLRYLDLSSNEMEALPESICKLYQLQTLRLIGCHQLKELPRELHRLENIRHIETSHFLSAPKGVGQLTSLQTLPNLRLRDGEGWTIDELGRLGQVKGEMRIEGLENLKNKEKAKEVGLKRKDKIVKLYLVWGHLDGQEEKEEISSEEYVLDCLEPHPDLQSLVILGFKGVRFPRWVRTMSVEPLQSGNPTQLNSLATVVLKYCMRCQQLPSLGQLPNLKVLCLERFEAVECIGEEFYESNNISSYTCSELPIIPTAGGTKRKVSFPNLIQLDIWGFEKLTTWDPPSSSATAFPSLESLIIWDCPNLRKIPTTLQECTSLQDLWIENCPSIEGPDVPDISRLQHLTVLGLKKAGKLSTSSPQRIRHLCGLTKLSLTGLTEEWDITLISSLSCLKSLKLGNCPNFKPQNSSLDFLSSSKLQTLDILEFDEMEALPEWIGNLRSLQTLRLTCCKKLKYLPSKQAMQGLKLQDLEILRCPLLEERLEKRNNDGPADSESQSQWPKISIYFEGLKFPLLRLI